LLAGVEWGHHQPSLKEPLTPDTPLPCVSQNQFDSIDLSDNAILILEGFPQLSRLRSLYLNNNRIIRVGRNLEGEPSHGPRFAIPDISRVTGVLGSGMVSLHDLRAMR